MKFRIQKRTAAFTLWEAICIAGILAVGAVILLVEMNKPRRHPHASCVNQLKQISLAMKQWALDHDDKYPMHVSVTNGGTLELVRQGNVFTTFLVMSNELDTPRVVICPEESDRIRKRATSWGSTPSVYAGHVQVPFTNNFNTSYFVGVDAEDAMPEMFLVGDRNVFKGVRPVGGVVGLTTNNSVGLGPGLHKRYVNVALADGSVQQLTAGRLREALARTDMKTNWLALP